MVHRIFSRVVGIVGLSLAASGCAMFTGPDWEEIASIADKQLAAAKEFSRGVEQLTQPPGGNAGAEAQLAYQVRMASYQVNWDRFQPTVLNDVLRYVGNRESRQLQAAGLALQAVDMGLKYGVGGRSTGGGNKVVFQQGDRKSGGGEEGGSASGDNSMSDIYVLMDKANGAWDSDRVAQGKDAQYQEGDGVQGQAFSRPFNQPQPETEGGGINNDSEGLGFDGSL